MAKKDGPIKTVVYWVAAIVVIAFIVAMVGDANGIFNFGEK